MVGDVLFVALGVTIETGSRIYILDCKHRKQCIKCGGPVVFIVWTAFWALWHLTWLLVDVIALTEKSPSAYFRYLTNWGYILLLITSWVDLITTVAMHCCCNSEADSSKDGTTRKNIIPTWIFFDTAKCTALEITIGYYLYLIWSDKVEGESAGDLSSIIFHAVNAIYVILNLLMSAKPVGVCHWPFSVILAFVYVIVSIILQYSFDIAPVYPGLDWRDPWPNAIIFAIYVLLAPILIHFVIYGLQWCFCKSRGRVDEMDKNETVQA